MKKTIYLIQEPACLNPHSGAFQHISMGVKYLSKAFDLEIYLTTEKIKLEDHAKAKKTKYVHKQNTEIKGWL